MGEKISLEAYFRGRRLVGRHVDLPAGYTGVIVEENKTQQANPHRLAEHYGGLPGTPGLPEFEDIREYLQVAQFDDLVLWEHEAPIAADDVFVRGLVDWPGLAHVINGPPARNPEQQASTSPTGPT